MKVNRDGCRHRGTWLICGGSVEWCYECGAWRQTKELGIASVVADSPWCYPVGVGAENPWSAWDDRREFWRRRYRSRSVKDREDLQSPR